MWNILFIYFIVGPLANASERVNDGFYIRDFFAKCLKYNSVQNDLVFESACSEKFRWLGGLRIIHVPSNKCMSPKAGNGVGLSTNCAGTNTLFQYQAQSIRHLISGKYFCHEGANNASVLVVRCDGKFNLLYFLSRVYFVIRHHFSGLCWVYDLAQNIFKLEAYSIACDRFEYDGDKRLKHVATGNCVHFNGALRLTSNCLSTTTVFELNQYSVLVQTTSAASYRCVHPLDGKLYPKIGIHLVLHRCSDNDIIRWRFYDDRYVLNVKLISEVCDSPSCTNSNSTAQLIVNGHDHSQNNVGINIIIFDYRSGSLGHRGSYDVHGNVSKRTELAAFLNSIPDNKIVLMAVKGLYSLNMDLMLSLQRLGVHAEFATVNSASTLCSMVSVSFTGNQRKYWETSVVNRGGKGGSKVNTSISVFHDFNGQDDCSDELGIRTKKLPDSRFSASSLYSQDWNASFARLLGPKGWCSAAYGSVSDSLTVDLGVPIIVGGIAIQSGSGAFCVYKVTRFIIRKSIDGILWEDQKTVTGKTHQFERFREFFRTVHWFAVSLTRFIRVQPTERAHNFHCLRLELFGCAPKVPFFTDNILSPSSKYIGQHSEGKFSLYAISPPPRRINVTFSATNDVKFLGKTRTQGQLQVLDTKVSASLRSGTVVVNSCITRHSLQPQNGVTVFGHFFCYMPEEDYYVFNVNTKTRILDQGFSKFVWNTLTLETDSQLVVSSKRYDVNRCSKDESILKFYLNNLVAGKTFTAGEMLQFNTSITHWIGRSNANAYNLEMFIYFDTQVLVFDSVNSLMQDPANLLPTTKTIQNGLIYVKTDTFPLYAKQLLVFKFKFKNPPYLRTRKLLNGNVMVDFRYSTNVPEYNGNTKLVLGKYIPYEFKVEVASYLPNSVAFFSMLYDEANDDFFVCKEKRTQQSICYWHKSDRSWNRLSQISEVIAIDTTKRLLYGFGARKNYLVSSYPFRTFLYMEESAWSVIETEAHVKKGKAAHDFKVLPSSPDASWVLPSAAWQIWAATQNGVYKRVNSVWTKYAQW